MPPASPPMPRSEGKAHWSTGNNVARIRSTWQGFCDWILSGKA